MRYLQSNRFLGPNRWSRHPVTVLVVERGATCRTFEDLRATVQALHDASGIKLSSFASVPQGVDQAVMAFEYEDQQLFEECLRLGLQLCLETPLGHPINTEAHHRHLVDLADDLRLGPSSRAITSAAEERGIPYFRLNSGSLVQFGEGAYQRRTWTAETDATSAIAEAIASDKQMTRNLLQAVGVPVPQGCLVSSRDAAWETALQLGLPVAIKPPNANHANGVSLDLCDREAILAAYDWACLKGQTDRVLVEQYIVGEHHRLLVVGGRMVAAAKGQREYVVGDGHNSVRQLVDLLNADPRRGENYTDQLQIVELDDAAKIELSKQGLEFDSVPDNGRRVLIWHVGDLIEDCTDTVAPETKRIVELAANTIGLDIAGMDLVAADISQPLEAQRGCIIEVNAGPSLSPHINPLVGRPQPVGSAILQLLYPDNSPAKVLSTLILLDSIGTEVETAVQILRRAGHCVGFAGAQAQLVSDVTLARSPADYRQLLMHPQVTATVMSTDCESISESGLMLQHLEIVALDGQLLSRASHCAQAADALATIANLITDSSQVIVIGDVDDAVIVSQQLRLPPQNVIIAQQDNWASHFERLVNNHAISR